MSPVKKVGDMLQLFTKRKPVVIKYAVSSSKTVSLWLSNSLGSRWPSYVSMHLPTSSSFELSGSLSKLVSTHFSVRSLQSGIFSQVPRSHLDSLSRSHFYEGRLLSSLAVRAHKPIPAYVEYTHALFEHNYKPVTAGTFLAYHQAPSKYGLMNAILRRFYNAQARPVYFYSFKVMGAINSSPYRYCFVSSVPLRFLSDDFYAVYDRFLSLSSRFKNVIRVGFFSSIIEFFAPGLIADISRLSFEMPSDTILRISLCEEF